jgi:hypothetical protein
MSTREDGILSRADFTFDRQRNLYIAPEVRTHYRWTDCSADPSYSFAA